MSKEIKTKTKLVVGNEYYCLIINYSIGGRREPSTPACFPMQLRYDGNDENNIPIFSEKYFTVTKNRYSMDYDAPKFRRYNNDNFIVVGILPDRLEEITNNKGINFWKRMLDISPIEREYQD